MLPESLTKIIESVDYVNYDLHIRNIDFSTKLLKVDFSIHDSEGSNGRVNIRMTILGEADYCIAKHGNSSYNHLENEHPLLWRFSDIQCELYIKGQTTTIKELIFDLFSIHHSLFGPYVSFDPSIIKTLERGHGVLQNGSKKLLKLYAETLNEYGIKTSIIGEHSPSKHLQDLKILFLGNSYFIGDQYEFEVLD